MGEEGDYEMVVAVAGGSAATGDGEDGRVLDWEIGLPSPDDLTPLSQSLISPELASAFSISPEPSRTMLEVHRASESTISDLLRHPASSSRPSAPFSDDPSVLEPDGADADADADEPRPDGSAEEAESSAFLTSFGGDDHANRTLKRPRLVWTPQLHKRFVDVVSHLGIRNAVPKTIMQLMNVEGLTRENVASHLQKYRLYLKRMQGVSDDAPSPSPSSDHLQTLFSKARAPPMPVPYGGPAAVIHVPVFGMLQPTAHNGSVAIMPVNGHQNAAAHRGYDSNQAYGFFGSHRRD